MIQTCWDRGFASRSALFWCRIYIFLLFNLNQNSSCLFRSCPLIFRQNRSRESPTPFDLKGDVCIVVMSLKCYSSLPCTPLFLGILLELFSNICQELYTATDIALERSLLIDFSKPTIFFQCFHATSINSPHVLDQGSCSPSSLSVNGPNLCYSSASSSIL